MSCQAGVPDTLIQSGFVLGVGIPIDTFVVRSITVPTWCDEIPWRNSYVSDDIVSPGNGDLIQGRDRVALT